MLKLSVMSNGLKSTLISTESITTDIKQNRFFEAWGIGLFLLALALRLFFVFYLQPTPSSGSDPFYYDQAARGLIAGEGFHLGQLFAYIPPFYPSFLAAIYFLFGHSYLPVQIIQALLGALTCIFVYLIGLQLGGKRMGMLAGILMALHPQLARYPSELWTENLFIPLLWATLLCLLRLRLSTWPKSLFWGIAVGLLAGLASLTREIGLPLMIIILFVEYLLRKKSNNHFGLKKLMLTTSIMLLVILPWTIRNYILLHHFVPITIVGGINFYQGNNPRANGNFIWILPEGTIWNQPWQTRGSFEYAVSSKCISLGIKYALTNPLRSCKLGLTKYWLLWRPPYYKINLDQLNSEMLFRLVWLLFYIVILAGTVIGVTRQRYLWPQYLFLYLILIVPSLIHMILFAFTRHRLPFIPSLILLASSILSNNLNTIRNGLNPKNETIS